MKIFSVAQSSTVVGLIFFSLALGNVIDRIPKGLPKSVSQTACYSQPFSELKECTKTNYQVNITGWPFEARKFYNANDPTYSYQKIVNAVPISRNNFLLISLNSLLIVVVAFAAYIFYSRHQGGIDRLAPDLTKAAVEVDEPIISSSDMLNEAGLASASTGTIGSYSYNLMSNSSGRIMMLLTLNKNLDLHVVAIGQNSQLSLPLSDKIDKNFLSKVELEGDFSNDFHLYCTPTKEVEVRQLFEPATMEFLMDFCQSYDFEVFQDSLYISQAENATNQGADLVADTTRLLGHISLDFPTAQ